MPLALNGGVLRAGSANGFALALGYAGNNAMAGTALGVKTCSASSAAGRQSGTSVLCLQLEVSGTRTVTFNDVLPVALLRSPLLREEVRYGIDLFAGGQPVGMPYDAGKAANGTIHFRSPLSSLSLSPRVPLVVEVVMGARAASSSISNPARTSAGHDVIVKSAIVPLSAAGGSVPVPWFGGFSGSIGYASNNAASGVMLELTNSATNNLQNAPSPPSGSVVLYLEADVSGSQAVAFKNGPRVATLSSASLVPGKNYGIYLFEGSMQIGSGYSVGTPSNGKLSHFPSPLRGVSITPGTPLVIELAAGVTLPTPTPSPSPSPSPTPSPTPTDTPSPTPKPTPIPTDTPIPTPMPSPTPTNVPIGQITEYAVPTGSAQPLSIAMGADRALWFTESASSKIGRITPDGVIHGEYQIPNTYASPVGIAPGPDGALWFIEIGGNNVGRINGVGQITEYPIATGDAHPSGIAAGPDGALWFTESNANNIGRITTSGQITAEYPIPTGNAYPLGIASGPDGALWFTEASRNNIGRITTAGQITEYPVPTGNSLFGIVAGPDGALWFTEYTGNNIGRITTDGKITEYPTPTGHAGPLWIASGPDGALWFTEYTGNNIGRITTDGQITEYPVTTSNSQPSGIVAGPDGALWFTEAAGNNIGRVTTGLTPNLRRPIHRLEQPKGPARHDRRLGLDRPSVHSTALTELLGASPLVAILDPMAASPDGSLWFTQFPRSGVRCPPCAPD